MPRGLLLGICPPPFSQRVVRFTQAPRHSAVKLAMDCVRKSSEAGTSRWRREGPASGGKTASCPRQICTRKPLLEVLEARRLQHS